MFFFYDWVYYSTHKHFYALQTLLGDKLTTTGPEPIYGYSIIIYFSVYEYLIINNETIVRQPCVFFIRITVYFTESRDALVPNILSKMDNTNSPVVHDNKRPRVDSATNDGNHTESHFSVIELETLSTQEALTHMSSEDTTGRPETITIRVSVLDQIFSKLNYMESRLKAIDENQTTFKTNLLSQDIKMDRILSKVNTRHDHTPSAHTPASTLTSTATPATAGESRTRGNVEPDLRDRISGWKNKFHRRRMCYKQWFFNTEKSKIVKAHAEQDPPYLIRKHRPKFAYSEADYTDKVEIGKALQLGESKTLLHNATRHQQTITQIDMDISNAINTANLSIEEKRVLQQQWQRETRDSKAKSEDMVRDNIRFLKELPRKFPYRGFQELTRCDNNTYKLINNDWRGSEQQGGGRSRPVPSRDSNTTTPGRRIYNSRSQTYNNSDRRGNQRNFRVRPSQTGLRNQGVSLRVNGSP